MVLLHDIHDTLPLFLVVVLDCFELSYPRSLRSDPLACVHAICILVLRREEGL